MRHLSAQVIAALLAASPLVAQPREMPLWPDRVPGMGARSGPERVRVVDGGERVISNVHRPSITAYLPRPSENTGAAVIIAPGGGHRELWSDHEGHNPARWFQERGIAAFVLKYRLAKEDSSTYTVDDHALLDMKRAMRVVRTQAQSWGIDTARIGVMGFSAGGEVAALLGMRWDAGVKDSSDLVETRSSRPAFQALIYPGNSARFTVSKSSPPAFIVAGTNDRPDISRGTAELYLKYKEAGVPAELHIYAATGHGFGLRDANKSGAGKWPARFAEWLDAIKVTTPRQ